MTFTLRNKKRLLALAAAVIMITAAFGVLPASAGIDEVISDGAYQTPLAEEVKVVQPGEQAVKTGARVEMEYKVRPGDTLWRIAARSGLTVLQLARANNLDNSDIILVGQTLIIPDTTTTAAKTDKVPIGDWAWPVTGPITSSFGIRGDRPHEGIDIGAFTGDTVTAPEGGRVVWAAPRGTYGLTVIIDHGNGIRSLYAHCSKLLVHEGQQVNRREPIARVGNTGRSEGPHLHMEILRQGIPLDPLMFLKENLADKA